MKLNIILFVLPFVLGNSNAQTDKEQFMKHITTLASDEFQGRYSGTLGDTLSQNYIVGEFKKMNGMTLYGGDGLQRFNFANKDFHTQRETSVMFHGTMPLKWNKEFLPMAFSASGVVTAPVQFAGYGIVSPTRNDYDGLSVNGKWALIIRETPNDRITFAQYATDYAKAKEAQNRGAKGVLLVHSTKGRLQYLESLELWNAQLDIPVIGVSRAFANVILKERDCTIENLEKSWCDEPQKSEIVSLQPLTSNIKITRAIYHTANVIGIIEGSDPKLKNEIIIVGGHYDHCGTMVDNKGVIQVYNGALDNASGSAMVLTLAKHYSKNRPKRSVAFVLLAAEERGLVGAKFLAQNQHLIGEDKKVKLMVNFDMVGNLKNSGDTLTLYGVNTFKEGADITNPTLAKGCYVDRPLALRASSDHIVFSQYGLPVMWFYTPGPQNVIHTPNDDAELVDFEGMDKIYHYTLKVLDKLLHTKQSITFDAEVH